ncbi:Anaphase-promoting complex subunit 7 [Mortierella sp. AM989]|nr:Anaphase-promoting complex subunit 7 [Mortierella sp. AM989]
MEAGNARQHSPQERLAQLRETESLYNAGLFTSALLITGIHLSTVRRDEKWFQARALSRYARCLTRLQEHRRSIEYYRKATFLEDSPLPSDISTTDLQDDIGGLNGTESGSEAQRSSTSVPQPSVASAALLGSNMDEEIEKKQRQERELAKEKIIKSASNLAAKAKKAAMESRAKSTNRTGAAGGLTNTGSTSIPPVIPQSTAMKKRLASRVDEGSDGTTRVTRESPKLTTAGNLIGRGKFARTEATNNSVEPTDKPYDTEIDYAVSCFKSGHYTAAGEVIFKIPESCRTINVYLLLAKLDRKKVNILPEKACWECIAEIQPLAIEAYVKLLYLHVPLAILLNMIPSDSPEKQWMKLYLQGTENFVRMKFQNALSDFSALNEKYPDNIDIKLKMALCLKRLGKIVRSCFMYSQVRKLDNHVLKDMYHYGVCLKQLSKAMYLNKLASELLSCNDLHPDSWCVQALYWEVRGDKEKALQMVSRALQIHPDHCGALQLRGQLYMESSPLKALQSFREVYKIEKDIVTYEGLVNTYILMERLPEAVDMAKEAKKLMPDSAHALAIYGTAIYHAGEEGNEAARDTLLEALRMDPGCVQAASCLVLVYENQGLYEEAIQILDQQIDFQPPDLIHVKKAEIYSAMEQWELALSSYQSALSSNSSNARAREGLLQVEKILNGGDDEDEDEAEESDENDVHEGDTMDADLDQDHMGLNLDEDDVLTGDEDHEPDEDYRQQQQQPEQQSGDIETVLDRFNGQIERYRQTPSRPNQASNDQPSPRLPRQHPQHLNQMQQQRAAAENSIPGFGMDYPTPSRPNNPTSTPNRPAIIYPNASYSQREREYDEYEDGGDDMEE